ncbi:enolase [Rickettsiales bacterium]|nr:enolase [Rickettsiales bacterium]
MSKIKRVDGREIFDSRGWPTIETEIELADGTVAYASVPAGASVGSLEAIEMRDSDRCFGRGALKAVELTRNQISRAICGMEVDNQRAIDQRLIELDGTDNKSRLGSNAILGASLASARAAAQSLEIPLYAHLNSFCENPCSMPAPMMNIINGGMHANNSIDIQEFMIIPRANSIHQALCMAAEIFQCLKKILIKNRHKTSVGDEGGFAPDLQNSEEAIKLIMEAIEKAEYKPGEEIFLALDAAASVFYQNNLYELEKQNKDHKELIKYYGSLISKYPIVSIEDGMAEQDEAGWREMTEKLGSKIQLVGDDLFVTNSKILAAGIEKKLANAILIKPNQIGTVTETLETIRVARKSGYKTIISHRSGETEDTFISHLAVATGSSQIKSGSICRSERTAKYNELIRIGEKLSKM